MRKTYSKKAVKDIKRINSPTKQRIRLGIEKLPEGDVKKLRGHDNLYRLRIGDWRVIFSFPEKNIIYQLIVSLIPEDLATPELIANHETALAEYLNGETIDHEDIDWD